MQVLYLMSYRRHSHDLLLDWLLGGLYHVLGFDNVFAWPENDSLHTGAVPRPDGDCAVCAECPYDSDQAWPHKEVAIEAAIDQCDVAVIATQPGDTSMDMAAAMLRSRWPRNKPIVAVDSSDGFGGDGSWYRTVAGRPLTAFFKREVPLGDTSCGVPLPLCYPGWRVPNPFPQKTPTVFYHASSHGENGDGPGIPRMQLVTDLRRQIPAHALDVDLYAKRKYNLRPEEYHARMARSLVGASWNGAPYVKNWDSNRFWENFAFGLAQVAERPRIHIPKAPVDGVHCVYVDSVDQVGDAVATLLREPEKALRMAEQGHAWFLQWHTAESRAAYFCGMIQMLA